MIIRELADLEELRTVEELEQEVWGIPDREVVPLHLLVGTRHAGGLVAGAFEEGELVGVVVGLPSWVEGQPGLHSHMLGVRPDFQGRDIGEALKWFQRDWCLERGLPVVRWTFDPLQAANAHLNLNKLGAVGVAYLRDVYGELSGPLNEGVPSDRMLVEWRLLSPRVAAARSGTLRPPEDPGFLVTPLEEGLPGGPVEVDDARVQVAVPKQFTELLEEDLGAARRWREVTSRALTSYLGSGYQAEALVREPHPALVLVRRG